MLYHFLGLFLRATAGVNFKGKQRLAGIWLAHRDQSKRLPCRIVGGAQISCDLRIPYEAVAYLRNEEESDLRVLRHLLKPGQLFVDGGANIGLWTLVAATRGAHVLAFEPNPLVFPRLSEHVATNTLQETVEIFPSALSDQPAELSFESSQEAPNTASVVAAPTSTSTQVSAVKLDDVLRGRQAHGIKLDVEGHEARALRGAEQTLRQWSPWLCLEFNTELAGASSLAHWDAHRFLHSLGYSPSLFAHAASWEKHRLPEDWRTEGYTNLCYRKSP